MANLGGKNKLDASKHLRFKTNPHSIGLTMTRYRTAILTLAAFAASVGVTAEGAEQATEEQLLRIVQSDQASDHDKAVACEKLAIVGSAKSVLPLQTLLGTAKFSHYARYALQNIPDEEAGKSLRSALDKLEGELLVGAINSVAARRDDQAIDKLVELSVSADETVSAAALAALARIDTSRAISVLTTADIESRLEFADALLFCADRLARRDQNAAVLDLLRSLDTESAPAEIRAAALLSRVRYSTADKAVSIAKALLASPDEWRFNVGLQAVVEGEISDGAQLLENTIDPADPARHARILSVLRAMEARSAVNAARIAAQSEVAAVRIEGVRTLGSLGGASDARLLLDIAAEKSPIGDAARHSLAEMENDEVNTTIVAMLRSSTGAKSALAAELIGQRRIIEGAGAIVEAAKVSEDEQTRIAALEAASRLAVGDTLPALIELAADAKSDKECHLAKQAALAAASRVPDRDEAATQICDHLESATGEQLGFLLDALAVIGGSRALDAIATMAEMQDRDTQNEATRVLGNWPSADAAPLLLRLAGSDNPFAVRALRGYLRIARQFPVSESDRLTMCRNALQIADRNDERLLTLEVLERIPSVEALELATAELDTDRLGAKASESVTSIAQAVAPASPDAAAVAAKHVLRTGGSPETLAAAARLLAK